MALPLSKGDREYQKFVEDGSGNVTVRAVIEGTTGDLTVNGDLTVTGDTEVVDTVTSGTLIIDVDDAEALLVRKDGDLGDIFTVDTVGPTISLDASTTVATGLNFNLADNAQLAFGSSNDSSVDWSTAQATQNTLVWGLNDTSNSLIFSTVANRNKDHDHAAQTDPTVFIHSSTDPDTDNTQWLSLAHDQSNAVIDSGKGAVSIGSTFVPILSPAFDNFKCAVTQNYAGIGGTQYRNTSTDASAEMRFVVAANTSDYMAFTQPSSANVGTFFGITKGAGSFLFSTGNTRDMVVGAFNDAALVLGSNNTENMRMDSTSGVTASVRVQGNQGADVASANDVTLGGDGNVFEITDTTQINRIVNTGWQNGAEVTLVFADNVTVKHNQSSAAANIKILLAGAGDFAATQDDMLTLILCEVSTGGVPTGQAWREKARTAI